MGLVLNIPLLNESFSFHTNTAWLPQPPADITNVLNDVSLNALNIDRQFIEIYNQAMVSAPLKAFLFGCFSRNTSTLSTFADETQRNGVTYRFPGVSRDALIVFREMITYVFEHQFLTACDHIKKMLQKRYYRSTLIGTNFVQYAAATWKEMMVAVRNRLQDMQMERAVLVQGPSLRGYLGVESLELGRLGVDGEVAELVGPFSNSQPHTPADVRMNPFRRAWGENT